MKNLFKLVTLIAVVFGMFMFGQTKKQTSGGSTDQNNETRVQLATMVAQTKDNLSVIYNSGMSYEAFRSKVLGRSGAAVTQEGEAVLNKVFNYLTAGTSNSQIINTDSGIEMMNALVKLDKLGLPNGYALFSTVSDAPKLDTNIHPQQHQAKGSSIDGCKWYQLACWVDEIFGAGTMKLLVPILLGLLK